MSLFVTVCHYLLQYDTLCLTTMRDITNKMDCLQSDIPRVQPCVPMHLAHTVALKGHVMTRTVMLKGKDQQASYPVRPAHFQVVYDPEG